MSYTVDDVAEVFEIALDKIAHLTTEDPLLAVAEAKMIAARALDGAWEGVE